MNTDSVDAKLREQVAAIVSKMSPDKYVYEGINEIVQLLTQAEVDQKVAEARTDEREKCMEETANLYGGSNNLASLRILQAIDQNHMDRIAALTPPQVDKGEGI